MPPTLWRSPGPGRLVSRGGQGDSMDFQRLNGRSGPHHMSRGREDHFRGFLKNNLHFYAHHMSHHGSVEVPHGLHPDHLLGWGWSRRQPPPEARRDHLLGVLRPPAGARASVPFALARSSVADGVSLPGARITLEPASADRAGSLRHGLLRREEPRDAGGQLRSGVDHFWRAEEGQFWMVVKSPSAASAAAP